MEPTTASDSALLSEFATGASETAFAALVRRHVDMVYATALRQLGDPGLAEEVAQNVFVALARKSTALLESGTISGWIYRAALLESRHVLRSELRRRRREAIAVDRHGSAEGESPCISLIPLLDEALLRLREGDRLAILLRYFEEKPFREVGMALGISEDAAQKRVAKSLGEISRFFQRRGFQVSCVGASATALFAQATAAAPAHLAATVSRAALAASSGAGLSGLSLMAFQLMKLSKLQLVIAWVCLGGIPVAYEGWALHRDKLETAILTAQLADAGQALSEAHAQDSAVRRRARVAETARAGLPARAQSLAAAPAPAPAWVDASPFARVPKELLERVQVSALGQDWQVRPRLGDVLAMTPAEREATQRAVETFYADIRADEEAHLERLETPADASLLRGVSRVSFRLRRHEPEANAARVRLRESLASFLGATRADLALRFLRFQPGRTARSPDERMAPDEIFPGQDANSRYWNFHGYERVVTFVEPRSPQEPVGIEVNLKFGQESAMGFTSDESLFNPASAPTLRAEWEALQRGRNAAPAK